MKRFLSSFVCLLTMMSSAFGITVPLQGDGTETSPYLIRTKDDLIQLSKLTCPTEMSGEIMSGEVKFTGKFFKLANDIDLEYSAEFQGLWTPSSTMLEKYVRLEGTFDGDGHTIHRMRIDGVKWNVEPTESSLGIPNSSSPDGFGFISHLGTKGKVKDLNMGADCEIYGYKSVGGIVGKSYSYSLVENCRNYAKVTGYNNQVGGVVGFAQGDISRCYNAGDITSGAGYVGGIAGRVSMSISFCANTGNIAAEKLTNEQQPLDYVGGITGMTNNQSGINNNLNAGTVTGNNLVGGITGEMMKVDNSINYGMVNGKDTKTGAIAGNSNATFGIYSANCYYDSQILTMGGVANNTFDGVSGLETAVLTSGTPLEGYDDKWQFDAGMYPVLKQFVNEERLNAARRMVIFLSAGETVDGIDSPFTLASAEGLSWSLNEGASFSISGDKVIPPANLMENPDMLTGKMYGLEKSIPIIRGNVKTTPFPGNGTEESPYLLSTKEDLIKLSNMTSTNLKEDAAGKYRFKDTWFRLTNDIDLEYDENFIGISCAAPFVLKSIIHFDGVIDGDGHTIHRMKINAVRWIVSPEEAGDGLPTTNNEACSAETYYHSFVGHLGNGGVIRNLNIAADCDIVGFSPVGGIVASMEAGSLVENCRNYADVTGYNSQIGGIAGTVAQGARISGCYNAGNITTGVLYAGGIAGNNDGMIEHCTNTGDVVGVINSTNIPADLRYPQGIGGIAGNATHSSSSISNCLNTGFVKGKEQAGGLLGSFGMASDCLNYGIVKVDEDNLALSGNCFGNKVSMDGKFPRKLYYDAQINRVRAFSREDYSFSAGEGSESEQVTIGLDTETLISGEKLEGLDPELWQFDEGMYPVLKKFADEPKLIAARNIIALMPKSINAFMLTHPVSLLPYNGLSWTCDEFFSINNGIAKPVIDGMGTFTATALDGDLVKTFYCNIYNVGSVEYIDVDKEIESTEYYTLTGLRVLNPSEIDGQCCIKVVRYTDGTIRTVKAVNR